MKQLIAIVCLLMAFLNPLLANAEWELPILHEDFSIRGGVTFGMSKEEVVVIEKNNGNNPSLNTTKQISFEKMQFLDAKDVSLNYHFTTQEELSSFAYTINTKLTFSKLKAVMQEKYGVPWLTSELSFFKTAIWNEHPYNLFLSVGGSRWNANKLSGYRPKNYGDRSFPLYISGYAVWLIKYNDYAVVIELAEANDGSYLHLGYAGVSHDEMEDWLLTRQQLIRQEEQKTQDSYKNDI